MVECAKTCASAAVATLASVSPVSSVGARINVQRLIGRLWPYLVLMFAFAALVFWNGGVVLGMGCHLLHPLFNSESGTNSLISSVIVVEHMLITIQTGDKSNHIATVHTSQLLYLWPSIVFFSFPLLVTSLIRITTSLPPTRYLEQLRWIHRMSYPTLDVAPKPGSIMMLLILSTVSVHFNTIIHPFTLADNRHYVFYVFRLLRWRWWVRYAAIPVYVGSSWLCFLPFFDSRRSSTGSKLLRDKDNESSATSIGSSSESKNKAEGEQESMKKNDRKAESSFTRASDMVIWFLCTTMCLVTAPLVEPRYTIMPWIVWRTMLPGCNSTAVIDSEQQTERAKTVQKAKSKHKVKDMIQLHNDWSLYAETFWFLVVNVVTMDRFLFCGFEWAQEPGKVQRFMW